MRLNVDQPRALSVRPAIAQAARTISNGTAIGQYRDADKLVDIVLRQPLTSATRSPIWPTVTAHQQQPQHPAGPDREGRVRLGAGVLWREGRDYAATVRGDIVEGSKARP